MINQYQQAKREDKIPIMVRDSNGNYSHYFKKIYPVKNSATVKPSDEYYWKVLKKWSYL